MRWVLAVLVPVLLAAPAWAAVGDLTLKPCDPRQVGGWSVMATYGPNIASAPADCGTVNPAAKLLTMKNAAGTQTVLTALDSAKPDEKVLNLIRIDLAGKGKFKDAPALPITWSAANGTDTGQFGPLDVQLPRDGRQVPATMAGYIMTKKGGEISSATLTFGSCLEGQCAFGDKTRTVRIVLGTAGSTAPNRLKVSVDNGVPRGFTSGGDQMLIDSGDGRLSQKGAFGELMLVDGKWYDVTVSDDGKKVTATPPKSAGGTIKVDAEKWTAFLYDTEYALNIRSDKATADVPAGKYYVRQAMLIRGGTQIALFNPGKADLIEVVAGKTTEKGLGTSLKATLTATVAASKVTLNATISDAAGLKVFRGAATSAQDYGTIEIFGPDGKQVDNAKLEFT
jgi:hypothetical protein